MAYPIPIQPLRITSAASEVEDSIAGKVGGLYEIPYLPPKHNNVHNHKARPGLAWRGKAWHGI